MGSKTLFFNIVIISLIVCLFPASAFAAGNGGFKRLEWHFRVQETFIYDDNIFLDADQTFAVGTSETPVADTIFVLSPSIQISKERLVGEFFGFDVNYQANDKKFTDTPTEDYLEHDARVGLFFSDKGEHIRLTLRGRYLDTFDASNTEFGNNFFVRAERTDITWSGVLEWKVSKRMTATATGKFRSNQYEENSIPTENFEEVEGGGSAFYQITPLTAIGLKYNFKDRNYTRLGPNPDSETHSILAAVRWKPTAIISGDFAIGYENQSFDGASGEGTFSYYANLNYHLNKRTRFHLGGTRNVENSSFAAVNSYVRTYLNLSWNQAWTSRINSTVRGGFLNRDYDTLVSDIIDDGGKFKRRSDNNFMLELNGTYNIHKWINAGASYKFENNNSNFNVFDYRSNIFTLFLSAGF